MSEQHVTRLDHVAVYTADLATSVKFYEHFLGLKPGWRPPFKIGGAWLYQDGGDPIVHLIEREAQPKGGMFYHFALRGAGIDAYLAKVKATGEWYTSGRVPGTDLIQIQHYDPNGVLVEVNFLNEPLDDSELVEAGMDAGGRPASS